MKMSAEEYGRRVRRVGPPSPLGGDCLWAFGVGGSICLLGEVLRGWYLTMGLDKELAGTLTSCTLVALSALLTTLGLYQKLAAKAGAGTLVPITGFANAVVSAAIEFKTEGRVLGTGAKMFIIAGPVIVYGTLAAGLYGQRLLDAAVKVPLPRIRIRKCGNCTFTLKFSIPQKTDKISPIKEETVMAARRGDTLLFSTPPVVAAHAAIGGKKEGEGPLAACFDELSADNFFGQSNWEAAEKEMALRAARLCLKKAETTPDKVSLALAGDLQAQCTASSYALRELGIPFAGLFGACSTMAEALGLGAALCSAGMADGLLAMTSSHFCAAERQFRTPLSYGAVRTPTAQWTATAAGACLLRPAGEGVQLCAATFGRVQDYKIKDINNMGAAMAPAAAATLLRYLKDTGSAPADFDRIYTGDLGHVGSQLLRDLLAAEGLLLKNHVDCGCILYDAAEQTVKSCGHILPRLEKGTQKRVLFIATGALMSQTTFLQKESIPAIAHLVELRSPQQKEENG